MYTVNLITYVQTDTKEKKEKVVIKTFLFLFFSPLTAVFGECDSVSFHSSEHF